MNIIPADTYECSQRLWKVLKTNYDLNFANRIIHELLDNNNFGILEEENIDITREFQTYREMRAKSGNYEITQMSLPHRFGMYKSPTKTSNTKENIAIESIPIECVDVENNPNHKVRSIF